MEILKEDQIFRKEPSVFIFTGNKKCVSFLFNIYTFPFIRYKKKDLEIVKVNSKTSLNPLFFTYMFFSFYIIPTTRTTRFYYLNSLSAYKLFPVKAFPNQKSKIQAQKRKFLN